MRSSRRGLGLGRNHNIGRGGSDRVRNPIRAKITRQVTQDVALPNKTRVRTFNTHGHTRLITEQVNRSVANTDFLRKQIQAEAREIKGEGQGKTKQETRKSTQEFKSDGGVQFKERALKQGKRVFTAQIAPQLVEQMKRHVELVTGKSTSEMTPDERNAQAILQAGRENNVELVGRGRKTIDTLQFTAQGIEFTAKLVQTSNGTFARIGRDGGDGLTTKDLFELGPKWDQVIESVKWFQEGFKDQIGLNKEIEGKDAFDLYVSGLEARQVGLYGEIFQSPGSMILNKAIMDNIQNRDEYEGLWGSDGTMHEVGTLIGQFGGKSGPVQRGVFKKSTEWINTEDGQLRFTNAGSNKLLWAKIAQIKRGLGEDAITVREEVSEGSKHELLDSAALNELKTWKKDTKVEEDATTMRVVKT